MKKRSERRKHCAPAAAPYVGPMVCTIQYRAALITLPLTLQTKNYH